MAASDNAALTGLELNWVNDRRSEFRFRDHCGSSSQTFANLARVLSWQLNHFALFRRKWQTLLSEKIQFVEVTALK
jgi:hypothetical protein